MGEGKCYRRKAFKDQFAVSRTPVSGDGSQSRSGVSRGGLDWEYKEEECTWTSIEKESRGGRAIQSVARVTKRVMG